MAASMTDAEALSLIRSPSGVWGFLLLFFIREVAKGLELSRDVKDD